MNPLVSRMEEIQRQINPPLVDPLAVELGMVPAPAPYPQAQVPQAPEQQVAPWSVPQGPGVPPATQQQPLPAGFPLGQQPPQPGQQPQQPQPGQPGAPSDAELVQAMIQQEAQRAAQATYEPILQRQEAQRRRSEGAALLEDYPDLRDPSRAQALLARSRDWAAQLGAPAMAGEPGFVELVYHAANSIAQAQAAAAAAQAQAQPQVQAPGTDGQLTVVPGTAPAQAPAYPGMPAAPAVPAVPGVTLETPGGTPPAPVNQNDIAAMIVGAGRGGLSSFWGG
jgi:hypothetical protein